MSSRSGTRHRSNAAGKNLVGEAELKVREAVRSKDPTGRPTQQRGDRPTIRPPVSVSQPFGRLASDRACGIFGPPNQPPHQSRSELPKQIPVELCSHFGPIQLHSCPKAGAELRADCTIRIDLPAASENGSNASTSLLLPLPPCMGTNDVRSSG